MAQSSGLRFGVAIGLGAGIGTAVGVAMDNIGVGVALGLGIAIAMWALFNVRKGTVNSDRDNTDASDGD